MNESKPLPSRYRPSLAGLARWALAFLLAMWLAVIGLGIGLHGFIVPRIGDWRGEIETWVSQATGLQVRIQKITARSEGIVPTIELQALHVLDEHNQAALAVPKVVLGVSVRSLLRGGVEQLYIEGAQLHVRRSEQGIWHVAGVPLQAHGHSDGAGVEWLLAQPESVLRHASIWVEDAYVGSPVFGLTDVNALLRGGAWRQAWHFSALPVQQSQQQSGQAAQRIELTGLFRPALLSQAPTWQRWSGQLYAQLNMAQLPILPWPDAWPVQRLQVQGQTRLWLDVRHGALVGVTADAALSAMSVDWHAAEVSPLVLQAVTGRLQAQRYTDTWAVALEHASFQTPEGLRWHSERVAYRPIPLPGADQGHELQWDRADVRIVSDLAHKVPGLQVWHAPLQRWRPTGVTEDVQLRWQQQHYQAQGRFTNVSVQAQPLEGGKVGLPGVEGLSGSFELTEQGGTAHLAMRNGWLDFPGVFAQPRIPIDRLQAQVRWKQEGVQWHVRVQEAAFQNTDARGALTATWRTGDAPEHRLPGVLQLQGVLHEAQGDSVHRYLPLQVSATARDYVRDSVKGGVAEGVHFEVAGDLRHMPFRDAQAGRFYIEAPLRDVVYDYVPLSTHSPDGALWPGLRHVQGTLVFDGPSMEVRNASTEFAGVHGLAVQDVNVRIADLAQPRVQVQARGTASVQSMLDFVRHSPVERWTGHALAQAQAQGTGELNLQLDLPIFDLTDSQVQGALALRNNSLHLREGVPALQALSGQVLFSHAGFSLEGVQGHSMGGAVRLAGGLLDGEQQVRIQAQGVATAQGLREAPWQVVRKVAEHTQGHAAYDVQVHASSDAVQVQVHSPLNALEIGLPAPLHKPLNVAWPLKVMVQQTVQGHHAYRVDVHDKVHVAYEWSEKAPRVRGMLQVGSVSSTPALPPSGVVAAVSVPTLDADAWSSWWSQTSKALEGVPVPQEQDTETETRFWPQQIKVDVAQLLWRQRSWGGVSGHAAYASGRWAGRVHADFLDGEVDFYSADTKYPGGRVFARLQHLVVPKSAAEALDSTETTEVSSRPLQTLPALDIQVNDVHLYGMHLGRMEVLAVNRVVGGQREWWLERLDMTMPQAQWRSHGRWTLPSSVASRAGETSLTFALEIQDAGQLLQRLGHAGVIAGGRGHMGGLVQWSGSPVAPDRSSMHGQLQLQIGQGQFLKVEPGAGKLLSVLSLQSLSRRVALDFRDVFSQGFAFDHVRGDVQIREGVAMTQNLQMKGLNAAVLMEGQAHLVQETQDLRLVVVPEINAMTASLAASVVNPVIGLGTFLAQMVLRGPVMAAATRSFHVHGSWADPMVERIDEVRATATPVAMPPAPALQVQGAEP